MRDGFVFKFSRKVRIAGLIYVNGITFDELSI